MSASSTDKFIKGTETWTGAVAAGGVSDGVVTTIPLVSTTNLPTDTAVEITIDRVDSNGTKTPTKKEVVCGVVSGTNIISCTRGVEGTAQAHSAGAVVEIRLTASQWNKMIDAMISGHGQDGSHTSTTISVPTHAATSKATPADADELPIVDSAASNVLKKLTWTNLKATLKTYFDTLYTGTTVFSSLNAPEGFLINGKIVPSVASNNLTVAIKGMDGNDPSATNPVYCRIGGVVRSITAALSKTLNAGANSFNSGSAELATKEIDYFVYLGYNATDGVVVGFSRIAHGTRYDSFSATATSETFCSISTITNAAAGDYYNVIGRFAATLSAGAGYTWSVPTFTASNLIQRPIYNTRWLAWTPVFSGFSAAPSTVASRYFIQNSKICIQISCGASGTSNANTFTFTLPLSSGASNVNTSGAGQGVDNGAIPTNPVFLSIGANSPSVNLYKDWTGAVWTTSGAKNIVFGKLDYEI